MTARTDFFAGARVVMPILLGIIPFGLVAGVTAVNVGMSPIQAISMSVLVFAGAAQLAAIDLIGQTAPVVVIVLTVIVINLRFMMYSASLAQYFRQFNPLSKFLSGYLITDQAFAVSVVEFRATEPDERSRKWFYFGAAVPFWITWQLSTIAGAILGTNVPEGLSLEFAVPLMFIALLFPALDDRLTGIAALVAGSVSVVAAVLPFNLGLVTAALIGIVAGVLVERRRGRSRRPETPQTNRRKAREARACDHRARTNNNLDYLHRRRSRNACAPPLVHSLVRSA